MQPLDPAVRPSCPEFDVHLTENVPVAMRDGVGLATDVYRPARDGRPLADPRPVLLHRTPYNKTETESALGECRWFAGRTQLALVPPYEKWAIEILTRADYDDYWKHPSYPTSNLFMPGHRIRLDIASSNHLRFDVNPNTGKPIGRDRRRVVADNTVFHERGHESRVALPIIPLEPSHP